MQCRVPSMLFVIAGCGRIAFNPLASDAGADRVDAAPPDATCSCLAAPQILDTFDLPDGAALDPSWVGDVIRYRIANQALESAPTGALVWTGLAPSTVQVAAMTLRDVPVDTNACLLLGVQGTSSSADHIEVGYHNAAYGPHLDIYSYFGGSTAGMDVEMTLAPGTRLGAILREDGSVGVLIDGTLAGTYPLEWPHATDPGRMGIVTDYTVPGVQVDDFAAGACCLP